MAKNAKPILYIFFITIDIGRFMSLKCKTYRVLRKDLFRSVSEFRVVKRTVLRFVDFKDVEL